MNWYMVVFAESGEAYSLGTEVASPLADQYAAIPLSDQDAESLLSGTGRWDATSRSAVAQ